MITRLQRAALSETSRGSTRIINPFYPFPLVLRLAILGAACVAQIAHAQGADAALPLQHQAQASEVQDAGTDEAAQEEDSDAGQLPEELLLGAEQPPPPQGRVFIENKTGYPIDLIEYGYDGTYRPYAQLADGEVSMETVGAGLMWLFRINQEVLIAKYITTDAPYQLLVLDAKTLTNAGYQPKGK